MENLRKRAENFIASYGRDETGREAPDPDTLMEELLVYQTELEMQNEELRRAEEARSRERERYVELYDFAPVGYFSLDQQGVVREINLKGALMLARERRALVGRPLPFFNQEEGYRLWRRLRDIERRGTRPTPLDIPLSKGDKTPLWVRVEIEKIEEPDDETRFRCAMIDISGERALANDRKRLDAHLLRIGKLQGLSTLVGGVSHDFNNVLQAVYGFANLLRKRLPDEGKEREYLDRIMDAAVRGKGLTDQIRLLTRPTADTTHAVSLNEVAQKAMVALETKVTPGTTVTFTPATTDDRVRVEVTHLEQVVANLLTNAVEAMPQGGRLALTIGATPLPKDIYLPPEEKIIDSAPYLYVRVADTGRGIKENIIGEIFDPFFTSRANEGGTGLGLSIVYSVVRQYRGAIDLATTSLGTTFTIYFPQAKEGEAPVVSLTEEPPSGRGERIVLLDDDPLSRYALQENLSLYGYEVVAASSPQEMADLSSHGPFDLVVADHTNYQSVGDDIRTTLSDTNRPLPMVVVSGAATASDRVEEGVVSLAKPVSPDLVALHIARLLDERD